MKKIFITLFSVVLLSACGGDDDKATTANENVFPTFDHPHTCGFDKHGYGSPGNIACPYSLIIDQRLIVQPLPEKPNGLNVRTRPDGTLDVNFDFRIGLDIRFGNIPTFFGECPFQFHPIVVGNRWWCRPTNAHPWFVEFVNRNEPYRDIIYNVIYRPGFLSFST